MEHMVYTSSVITMYKSDMNHNPYHKIKADITFGCSKTKPQNTNSYTSALCRINDKFNNETMAFKYFLHQLLVKNVKSLNESSGNSESFLSFPVMRKRSTLGRIAN